MKDIAQVLAEAINSLGIINCLCKEGTYMYIDWTYIILVLPAVIFSLWASRKVNTTYQQYQTQFNSKNITGAQAARFVLDRNGLSNIRIEEISGTLTDHFDPSAKVIRLSSGVYGIFVFCRRWRRMS